jgi:biofilm PGA synthesis N-glycosyltransferase PgaC
MTRVTTEADAVPTLVVVVPFLNEAWCLDLVLNSIASQSCQPDVLILVDDGSTDASPQIADAFALHRRGVRVRHNPSPPPSRDRLIAAAELRAFQAAVEDCEVEWDVVAKVDGDLKLTPETFATVMDAFAEDPALGMAGVCLSEVGEDGRLVRLESPREHVEGATRFYRRACWRDVEPIPAVIGWDTLDLVAARARGWRTRSFEVPGGDPIHLRRMGTHGPILRSFLRWGLGAYCQGAHPLHVLAYGLRLMSRRRPFLIGGLVYYMGWIGGALHRTPRADPALRAIVRREQGEKLRRRVLGSRAKRITGPATPR